jgi:hypothetical protein
MIVMLSKTISIMQQTRDQFYCLLVRDVGFRNEKTNLQSANQCIIHFLREELSSLVVDTRPTPDVFVVAVALGALENASCNTPHDGAENEVSNSEQSIVNCHFLRSSMTTSPVVPEYNKA